MLCDICNKEEKGTILDSDSVRLAVENGFDPFKLKLVSNQYSILNIDEKTMYTNWVQTTVKTSQTDWNLCKMCYISISNYLSDKMVRVPEKHMSGNSHKLSSLSPETSNDLNKILKTTEPNDLQNLSADQIKNLDQIPGAMSNLPPDTLALMRVCQFEGANLKELLRNFKPELTQYLSMDVLNKIASDTDLLEDLETSNPIFAGQIKFQLYYFQIDPTVFSIENSSYGKFDIETKAEIDSLKSEIDKLIETSEKITSKTIDCPMSFEEKSKFITDAIDDFINKTRNKLKNIKNASIKLNAFEYYNEICEQLAKIVIKTVLDRKLKNYFFHETVKKNGRENLKKTYFGFIKELDLKEESSNFLMEHLNNEIAIEDKKKEDHLSDVKGKNIGCIITLIIVALGLFFLLK